MVGAQHAASVASVHRNFHKYVLSSVSEEAQGQVPGYQTLGSALAAHLAQQGDAAMVPKDVCTSKHCIANLEGGQLRATVYCKKDADWRKKSGCCFGVLEGAPLDKVKQEALVAQMVLVAVKQEPQASQDDGAPEQGETEPEAAMTDEEDTFPGIPLSTSAGSKDVQLDRAPVMTTQDFESFQPSWVAPDSPDVGAGPGGTATSSATQENEDLAEAATVPGCPDSFMPSLEYAQSLDRPLFACSVRDSQQPSSPQDSPRRVRRRTKSSPSQESVYSPATREWTFRRHGAKAYEMLPSPK